LEKETGEKCGYCEASAKAVCHCDVEHMRPKALYWWLALCFDNYVLGCQLCNQTYKGDQYPLDGPLLVGPNLTAQTTDAALEALANTFAPDPLDDSNSLKRADFETQFADEHPGLINPYLDEPENLFVWQPDKDLSEVAIAPRVTSGHQRWRAQTTIDVLGLNREELRRLRWKAYRTIANLCKIYASGQLDGDPALKKETADTLKVSMDFDQFFAGLCRWTIREQHGLPL
jgi:hypothetical protein